MVSVKPCASGTLGSHFRIFFRLRDVGLALFRVVLRQWFVNDFAFRFCGADDFLGELQHRQFSRIANVHGQIVIAHHQTINAFDQIGDVTKAARLRAFAEMVTGLFFNAWLTNAGTTRPSFNRIRGP